MSETVDEKPISEENALLEQVRQCDPKNEKCLILLRKVKNFCQKDISLKTIFLKGGIYNFLINFIISSNSLTEVKKCSLECLHCLLDGYPDLLDKIGMHCLLSLLQNDVPEEMQILALKIITVSCIKHENNRQAFMTNGIADNLKCYLRQENKDDIIKIACTLPIVLTLNDDVRVAVSKAHSHAVQLAAELLIPLMKLLKTKSEISILAVILNSLSRIIVRNEHCISVYDQNGLEITLDIIKKNRENQMILTKCFKFLLSIVGSVEVRSKILCLDFTEELISALNRFMSTTALVYVCLRFISKLCLRNRENGRNLIAYDIPKLIVRAMSIHFDNGSIQMAGCWAIRNMAARNSDLHGKFLEIGTEQVLNNILQNHEMYEKDAKVALVELKCEVELQEPWSGRLGDKLKQSKIN